MREFSLALFVLICIQGVSQQANAEDEATERARKHYVQAQKEYDLGNWEEAAREFSWAYELRPDPIFLYNMAQAYRRGGNLQRAIDLYKNYLLKDPSSPQRTDVEQRIQRLQKQLDDERAAKATALPPAPPEAVESVQPSSGDAAAQSPAAPAPQPTAADQPASPAERGATTPAPATPASVGSVPPAEALTEAVARPAAGRGLRVAGVVTGAVGLLGIGGGVYFGLRARSLSDSVSNASRYSPADAQSGKNAAALQWVCYGAGGAALATGALLYWRGRTQGRERPPSFSLAPLVAPNTVGLASAGAF
jgi:tetratricopeptide (TPR) repeat protein